jgi:hypothetical protein
MTGTVKSPAKNLNIVRHRRPPRRGVRPSSKTKAHGIVARVDPAYSTWLVPPLLHGDRTTFVSSPSDYALPFCRRLAVAAAAGVPFGSVAIPRPLRIVIATLRDDVPDDLAATVSATGWLPKKPVAVCRLHFRWDELDDGGELGRAVKATQPEMIVAECGLPALEVVRTRFGDSDAAILCPTDAPADAVDAIRLHIAAEGDGFDVTGSDGKTIVRLDQDFSPLGRARFDVAARLRTGMRRERSSEQAG